MWGPFINYNNLKYVVFNSLGNRIDILPKFKHNWLKYYQERHTYETAVTESVLKLLFPDCWIQLLSHIHKSNINNFCVPILIKLCALMNDTRIYQNTDNKCVTKLKDFFFLKEQFCHCCIDYIKVVPLYVAACASWLSFNSFSLYTESSMYCIMYWC